MKKILATLLSGMTLLSCAACTSPFEDSGVVDGKYNITIAAQDEDGEQEILQILADRYQEINPNVNIVIRDFGGERFERFMARHASLQDELPMIMWAPDDQFAMYAEGGYFLDLRSYYESSAETSYDLYYESMLHAANYWGNYKPLSEDSDPKYGLYFAPRDYNQIAIVCNTKLFNQFGIEIPDTSDGWEMSELFELCRNICKKLSESGNKAKAYRAIKLFAQWEPVYTTMFKALGSDGVIQDGKLAMDTEQNKAIINKLYEELYGAGYYNDTNYMIDTADDFNRGTVFMTVVSRPLVLAMSKNLKDATTGEPLIDFLPFPAEYVGAGCSGYGIITKHAEEEQTVNGVTKKVKDICWDFIKFVISEEGQELAGSTGFMQPILKSLEAGGAWRSAISSDLNHGAWCQGKELRLTSYNVFEPAKRSSLRNIATTFFQGCADYTKGSPANVGGHIETYVEYFNRTAQ